MYRRRTILIALLLFGISTNPVLPNEKTVILINGLWSVVNPLGFRFYKRHRQPEARIQNMITPVDGHLVTPGLTADIVARKYRTGEFKGPLHFAGHSYGGVAAIVTAKQLWDRHQIRTASITLIDPAGWPFIPPVPQSVGRVQVIHCKGFCVGGIYAKAKWEFEQSRPIDYHKVRSFDHLSLVWRRKTMNLMDDFINSED